jgi:hypothetical protein
MTPTPSLRDVQHAVRCSLIGLDDEAAAPYVLADGIAPAARLAIYRNTYDGNLINALRLSFPAVHKLVGAEFFEGAARIFAREHPPRVSWLDGYGADFAAFLAEFRPAASLPYLADVAQLEWAVNRALRSPDTEPLDANRLAAVDPALHERICFVADPSITLLRTDHPADAIWRAVLAGDDAALGAIDLVEGPVRLLVQRRVAGIEVMRLDEPTFRITDAFMAGAPLGEALTSADASVATNVLAANLAAGRITAFRLSEPANAVPLSEFAA